MLSFSKSFAILVKPTLVKNKFSLPRHTLCVSLSFAPPPRGSCRGKSFKSIYESVRNVFRGSLAFFSLPPSHPISPYFYGCGRAQLAAARLLLPRASAPPAHLTCDGNVLLTCRGGVVIPPSLPRLVLSGPLITCYDGGEI